MFIKWQGKNSWTNLNQVDSIYIKECYDIDDDEEKLPPVKWAVMVFIGKYDANIGWYDTEERAKEVLNEILCQNCKVYEMPEE